MTQRNELCCLFRCLNAGDTRSGKNVSLCNPIRGDQLESRGLQLYPAARDCLSAADGLGRNIDHLRAAIGRDVAQVGHSLAADRDHFAAGLVGSAKIVLLRFAFHDVQEKLPQLRVARSCTQRRHDVELEITAETGAQLSVAG